MHLLVVGLNHKTAPVEVRERLAVSEGNLPDALESLSASECVSECCILSTCNRTEIYAVITSHDCEDTLVNFLSEYHGVDRRDFEAFIYHHRGHKAVEHLFSVAAGLDSMMLGEDQVLGQVRNAFCIAGESDSTRTILNNLFQQSISVGKSARTQTDISRGAFSVGYAAAELARSIFGTLKDHTVLVVGAGNMSELTAKHLLSAGARSMLIANRTMSRAEELARKLGGTAVPYDQLAENLTVADVVITSTGAEDAVITRDQVAEIMRRRGHSPVFMIDIAVPRDVEPEVGELEGVYLYNIDDLESLVEQSREERKKEVVRVKEIVAEETGKFVKWLRTLEAVPLIRVVRKKIERAKDAEWERSASKLAHLPEKDRETVLAMMRSLVNRVCHNPLIKMKEFAGSGSEYEKLDVARELFGIDEDELTAESEQVKTE